MHCRALPGQLRLLRRGNHRKQLEVCAPRVLHKPQRHPALHQTRQSIFEEVPLGGDRLPVLRGSARPSAAQAVLSGKGPRLEHAGEDQKILCSPESEPERWLRAHSCLSLPPWNSAARSDREPEDARKVRASLDLARTRRSILIQMHLISTCCALINNFLK